MPVKFAMTLNVGKDSYEQIFDSIQYNYIRFFEALDILPILIPNAIEDIWAFLDALDIQGIILTGGNDVSPKLYGEKSVAYESMSDTRDQIETYLLQTAIKQNIPVLGICRGMQFINVFFGGSLIQDIRKSIDASIDHVGSSHVNIITDEEIANLLKASRITVNSFHNQGVTAESLASDLYAFAISEKDGLIEGILHPIYPVLGIQWHPERTGSSIEADLCLIKGFLQDEIW